MALRCNGAHVPQALMRMGVRWSVAYPLRPRHGEARMEERGVEVAHATLHRGGIQSSPRREDAFPRRPRLGWVRWRLDETSLKVQGPGDSLARAVAQTGQPMDLRRTAQRAAPAALRFLKQAIGWHGGPETSPIAGRAAPEAALQSENAAHGPTRVLRKLQALHPMVDQEPRGVKRIPRPMLGCKALAAAQDPFGGGERMPRLKNQPMVGAEGEA